MSPVKKHTTVAENAHITVHTLESSTEIINFCSGYLKALKKERDAESGRITPVVRDAANYLEEHLSEDISLDDICSELKVSKFYLSYLQRTARLQPLRIPHNHKIINSQGPASKHGQICCINC
nr:hypothetical protein [uncultured Butyrivibrio sp.]